jgi:hypothetical protein
MTNTFEYTNQFADKIGKLESEQNASTESSQETELNFTNVKQNKTHKVLLLQKKRKRKQKKNHIKPSNFKILKNLPERNKQKTTETNNQKFMPISPNFQSIKTKKKINDIPGHSETKIEKKNDKGNLLGSEIDYIALKKEQNKVESREHDEKNATKDKAESEKYIPVISSNFQSSTTKKKIIPRRFNEQSKFDRKGTVICHFCKRLMFGPFPPHTENYKQWHVDDIHRELKCYHFDEDLNEYLKIKREHKEFFK